MTQRYMLDTNVISHIMQGRDAQLLARLTQLPVGQVVMSSVTLAELEYGLHRKGQPARLRNALTQPVMAGFAPLWKPKASTSATLT
jgi:tRNA(fMet)-specific endonuclease VapC